MRARKILRVWLRQTKVVLPAAVGLATMVSGWPMTGPWDAPRGAGALLAALAASLTLDLFLRRRRAAEGLPARARAKPLPMRGGAQR
jgi:hypothetical protein